MDRMTEQDGSSLDMVNENLEVLKDRLPFHNFIAAGEATGVAAQLLDVLARRAVAL